MKFSLIKNSSSKLLDKSSEMLMESCLNHGHKLTHENNGTNFVLNFTDTDNPYVFRRKNKSVFVISFIECKEREDLKSICYSKLIRSLSNLLICLVPKNGNSEVKESTAYFITPEAGYYDIPFEADEVYDRIIPIAGSNFASDNSFEIDLPEAYRQSTPVVEKLKYYGRKLDELGVLPAPFPLKSILSETDIRHIYKIYGITGASYGNLSARENVPELGDSTFWMTGRGVDKSRLSTIGKDIHLVKGMDGSTVKLSAPPNYNETSRVSVDAVEHELIYRTFPDVGAIIHVHAWIDGVLCTKQNYPCGTIELAKEVVDLLKRTDNPERTAVGLKNHGLTITGKNLEQIFEDIDGKLKTEVPMFN